MQAIDNLTLLSGKIINRQKHPSLSDYELVTMQVDRAEPVDGKADLLGRHAGTSLPVAVRSELLRDQPAATGIRLRARMTPGGAMAEPHPEPGNFSVSGP